ncbi:MAG: glycosyltransferase [Pseudomonadota bacterium]
MIFVTVGTQLPFDRLVAGVDAWCAQSGRGAEVFGQLGEIAQDGTRPAHFDWSPTLAPEAFDARMRGAELIISHAGMGTIIGALSLGTPIVLLARRAHLGEQRNDHQQATVDHFGTRAGIFVAQDDAALPSVIDTALSYGHARDSESGISRYADDSLIAALRAVIDP